MIMIGDDMYECFRAEVRDGFYVDGMMKRAWAAQMQELKKFDVICRKHGIRWYADWGTLLGAVRHHGFIPWDDDIDVCMLRDDYQKFKSIMYDEYPPDYAIICYDAKNPAYRKWDNLTRVMTGLQMRTDRAYLDSHFQCPYPAGLDIFPLDFIPDDPEECRQYHDLCTIIYTAMNPESGWDSLPDEQKTGLINAVETVTGYHFDADADIRMQIYRLGDAIFSMYHRDECSRVVMMGYSLPRGGYVCQKSWFEEEHYLPFEDMEIPVPSDTDTYLRIEFGEGYMVQNRGSYGHGYPFYGEAEQKYISQFSTDPFYYHASVSDIPEPAEDMDRNRKVLFVIPHASDWKHMIPYYGRLVAEGADISVMPIPFYDIDFYHEHIQENYEYEYFPDELPLVRYDETDIEAEAYDEILISFPYDQYNYTEDIDGEYYVSSLRERTGHLTYISPIVTDDSQAASMRDQTAMRHYVMTPGVVLSDTVYVQSEKMKESYIQRLCELVEGDEEVISKIFLKKIHTGVNK